MSTYVPPEFEYEMPPSPEPVVVSRSEAYLTTPAATYDTDTNNILRFEITGSQMLDLSSVRMYANLKYEKKAVVAGATYGALDPKDEVVSNMGLFQSIELTTLSGVVIERIDDANLLAVIMSHLCFGEKWSETTGSFSNSQKSLAAHQTTQEIRLEINAHKLLGFFHTGKFVMPSVLGGGLRLTFTLADARKLVVLNAATGTVRLSLSNVKLHYDLCTMSQRYQEWFNRQYATKGFRIIWDSYQGHTQHTFTPNGSLQQFPLQITAKRCKAMVMAVRPASDTTPAVYDPRKYSGALSSAGFVGGSYQIDVGGVRYPPTPIDSYPRAHEEAIKVCYSNNDVQTENISYDAFTTNFGKTAGADSDNKGRFLMCLDFEKYNSSGESGIVIAPNSTRLSIQFSGGIESELSAYLVRSQSLTVVGGQVVVDY